MSAPQVAVTLPLEEAQRVALGTWLAEYFKAVAAAESVFGEACRAARSECAKGGAVEWDAYHASRDAARSEYDKVRRAEFAKYAKVRDAHPLVVWIIDTFLPDRYEAFEVLEALSEGYDLPGLCAMAEDSGWCEVWDRALADAGDHFEIKGLE